MFNKYTKRTKKKHLARLWQTKGRKTPFGHAENETLLAIAFKAVHVDDAFAGVAGIEVGNKNDKKIYYSQRENLQKFNFFLINFNLYCSFYTTLWRPKCDISVVCPISQHLVAVLMSAHVVIC